VGRARDIRLAYLLLAPALLLLLTAFAYPIGWEVWTSFTNLSPLNDGSTAYVGLTNYGRILAGADFWQAASVTVGYAVVTSVAKLALGLGFALLRGRSVDGSSSFWPSSFPGPTPRA
jgi:multiple sugar transport system permease protein